MGIPTIKVKRKAAKNRDVSLKGPRTDSLTSRHSPWTLAKGEQLQRQQRHTEKDCVVWLCARARGTATIVPLLGPYLVQSTGRHHLACAEPSHCMANAKSALTGLDWLAPPRVFLRPHHNKLPVVNTLPSNQPHPAFSVSGTFMGGQWLLQPNHSPHISGENVHLPKLQCLLNRSQGSMGSRWAVAGLAVI